MAGHHRLSPVTQALAVGFLVTAVATAPAASATVTRGSPTGPAAAVHLQRAESPSDSATAPARRVVAQWNAIAVRTIVTEALTPAPVSPLYLSFTHVAMYDAAVAVRGGFRPYALTSPPAGAHHASEQVAVVTAAYTVLRNYFPLSAANLDVNYSASLALVPNGHAKDLGVEVGQAAAAAIIDQRMNDGRDDPSITLEPGHDPGEWRPTPPTFAAMAVPWLGFVKPMVLSSPTQLGLPGPDPLTSDRYTRDFREVKRMGSVDSSLRTPEQTETALFFSDNPVAQFQASMRLLAGARDLTMLRAARMFALVDTGSADAMISCWRGKYRYAYWRPITAIQEADADGNPATSADPTWTPLIATPSYPEYPSGHACMTGSFASGLSHLFGATHLDIDVSSIVTGTTRHYDTAWQLNRETKNARIWLGLHFRAAMDDGNDLGQRAARYVDMHAFQRIG
jgi:hypothetical protein